MIDIEEITNGVRVHFEDHGSCEGNIVVGCDGAHSIVRQIMWGKANISSPGLICAGEKRSKMLPTFGERMSLFPNSYGFCISLSCRSSSTHCGPRKERIKHYSEQRVFDVSGHTT